MYSVHLCILEFGANIQSQYIQQISFALQRVTQIDLVNLDGQINTMIRLN